MGQEWGWKVRTGSEKDPEALVAGRKRVEARVTGRLEASSRAWRRVSVIK